jgi:hypothetical protein
MTMRAIAAMFTALTLSGCSTSVITSEQAEQVPESEILAFAKPAAADDARITFVRDAGLNGIACDFTVFINGFEVASIGASEAVTFYHPPGQAILGVSTGTICTGAHQELSVNLEPGTAYQFRGFRNASGDPGISATGKPPFRYSTAATAARPAQVTPAGGMLTKDQWKQQQLQKLDQETGLSYEEYQRRYREITGQ